MPDLCSLHFPSNQNRVGCEQPQRSVLMTHVHDVKEKASEEGMHILRACEFP